MRNLQYIHFLGRICKFWQSVPMKLVNLTLLKGSRVVRSRIEPSFQPASARSFLTRELCPTPLLILQNYDKQFFCICTHSSNQGWVNQLGQTVGKLFVMWRLSLKHNRPFEELKRLCSTMCRWRFINSLEEVGVGLINMARGGWWWKFFLYYYSYSWKFI